MAPCEASLNGRHRYAPGDVLHRHRHHGAYAAVILSGGYEEAGCEGRHTVRPGDVLIHHAFDSHLDRMSARGAEVLNIALPYALLSAAVHFGRLDDPDELVSAYEREPAACPSLLAQRLKASDGGRKDWPDRLNVELASGSRHSLAEHAHMFGLRRETISRGFAKLYGVTPAQIRAEARARRAWQRIVGENTALVVIAQMEGFADQAHMTRAVHALTGFTPSCWRKSH